MYIYAHKHCMIIFTSTLLLVIYHQFLLAPFFLASILMWKVPLYMCCFGL